MAELIENNLKAQQTEQIRQACIKTARKGFMDASISGLCVEGAIEAAISAMQSLDLEKVIDQKS